MRLFVLTNAHLSGNDEGQRGELPAHHPQLSCQIPDVRAPEQVGIRRWVSQYHRAEGSRTPCVAKVQGSLSGSSGRLVRVLALGAIRSNEAVVTGQGFHLRSHFTRR